ncbi:MAG: hypothetical protein WDN03_19430 [Rhizomicrobium sp.]
MPYVHRHALPPPPGPIGPGETARYTRDLLETLKKMAHGQGHTLLAHLLTLAATEAKFIADQAQDT